MPEFILKKLGHQELGYENANTTIPGVSRGQYFLISKKHLGFFPTLKKEISQDLQILNLVSHGKDLPSQAKYIYDNDKYHGSTAKSPRNEHRININLKINPLKEVYHKGDILIFKKENFLNEEGEDELAFVLTRYRQSINPSDYQKLITLIDNKKEGYSSRNYASVSETDLSVLSDYRNRLFKRVMSLEPIIPELDDALLKTKGLHDGLMLKKDTDGLKSIEKQIKRIVFDKYDYKCLVSGIGYKWQEISGVKSTWKGITGAHIKPRAHDGEYSAENIIPLLEPIHQLFDRGIFTISDDYSIEIHENALNDPLLSNFHDYHQKKLEIPNGIKLSLDFIQHHRDEVFGNFTTGKQIRSN
jgi:hypothetical protein